MDKVFIDTDVILDFLLNREPFSLDAARIFSLSERRKINACTTGLVVANAYYILRKLSTHAKVTEKLLLLTNFIDIIPLPKTAVLTALQSDFNDFEDAIQNFSAMESKLTVIITRNVKDYKHSELVIMSPDTYLTSIS